MKKFKLSYLDNNDNIRKLNVLLPQLIRKSTSTTTFASPPIPVSFYADVFTPLSSFNHLISIDGEVDTLVIFCNTILNVKEIIFELTNVNKNGSYTDYITVIPGQTNIFKRELKFSVGDRISITPQYTDVINNLWIGFPYKVDIRNFNYNTLVIEELDRTEEDAQKKLDSPKDKNNNSESIFD